MIVEGQVRVTPQGAFDIVRRVSGLRECGGGDTGHRCTRLDHARTVADELRSGVLSGALTGGEADELLSRLRVLVDQALDLTPQPG